MRAEPRPVILSEDFASRQRSKNTVEGSALVWRGRPRPRMHAAPNIPVEKGTFPPSSPYNQLERKVRRSAHAHFPPLVHTLRNLLAARTACAHRLPIHLATAAPLPHRRRSRPRRARGHLPRHHAAVPPAGRAVPHIARPDPINLALGRDAVYTSPLRSSPASSLRMRNLCLALLLLQFPFVFGQSTISVDAVSAMQVCDDKHPESSGRCAAPPHVMSKVD